MRFLRTLQKNQIERERVFETAEGFKPQDKFAGYSRSEPPQVLVHGDVKIGAPTFSYQNAADTPAAKTARVVPDMKIVNGAGLKHSGLAPIDEDVLRKISIDAQFVNPHLVAVTQPRSTYCEEYRSLRTHLLLKGQTQKLQSIVIASVGPSEGKSVTALNLAWLFAQTDGVKALIIDSDLRRPSLAGYLGIEAESGLSEMLVGKASLQDSLVRLDPVGLYMLPGGTARNDVADLLSGPRFKEILDEARGMFDYVIIDAPPLGIFTDATVLINHADGALLVVRANQTRYKDIDRILESLPRERMLGTILNQSKDTLIDDSYYNYGYYENSGPQTA